MKVLLITSTLPPYRCGVGDYTDCLAKQLHNTKTDITVLTTSNIGTNGAYNVLSVIKDWNSFSSLALIIRLVKKEKYDIVHLQMPTALYGKGIIASLIIPCLRLQGVKTVITLHEYSFSTFGYRVKLLPALFCANKIIVVEPFYKTDICKKIKLINKTKFSYINIGSNIEKKCTNIDTIKKNRTEIDSSKEKMLVGAFGFVSEVKCFEIILEAIKVLKEEEQWKSKFVIISEVSANDLYQKKILEMINEYGLTQDIYITGFLAAEDVADMLASMDCACMLFKDGVSVRNGSFLAAMSQGLMVITSKPKYEFDYSQSCLFVENDVASLKSAIVKMQENYFSDSDDTIIDVSISKELSWESIANRHCKLYEELIH